MSTVKTPIVRNRTVYVSNANYQDCVAIALSESGHADDVMVMTPDQVADELLRAKLDEIPGIRERTRAFRKALDEVAKAHPITRP